MELGGCHTHRLALTQPWDHPRCLATLEPAQSPGIHATSSFLGKEPLITACPLILSPMLDKIPKARSRDSGEAGRARVLGIIVMVPG